MALPGSRSECLISCSQNTEHWASLFPWATSRIGVNLELTSTKYLVLRLLTLALCLTLIVTFCAFTT